MAPRRQQNRLEKRKRHTTTMPSWLSKRRRLTAHAASSPNCANIAPPRVLRHNREPLRNLASSFEYESVGSHGAATQNLESVGGKNGVALIFVKSCHRRRAMSTIPSGIFG